MFPPSSRLIAKTYSLNVRIGVSRPGISAKGGEIPGNLAPLWQGFAEEILNELEIQRMDFNHGDIS